MVGIGVEVVLVVLVVEEVLEVVLLVELVVEDVLDVLLVVPPSQPDVQKQPVQSHRR